MGWWVVLQTLGEAGLVIAKTPIKPKVYTICFPLIVVAIHDDKLILNKTTGQLQDKFTRDYIDTIASYVVCCVFLSRIWPQCKEAKSLIMDLTGIKLPAVLDHS